jgi:hypothetical protein
VHRDTETNLFIAVERTAMKNKLGADEHTGRRPEGSRDQRERVRGKSGKRRNCFAFFKKLN